MNKLLVEVYVALYNFYFQSSFFFSSLFGKGEAVVSFIHSLISILFVFLHYLLNKLAKLQEKLQNFRM